MAQKGEQEGREGEDADKGIAGRMHRHEQGFSDDSYQVVHRHPFKFQSLPDLLWPERLSFAGAGGFTQVIIFSHNDIETRGPLASHSGKSLLAHPSLPPANIQMEMKGFVYYFKDRLVNG